MNKRFPLSSNPAVDVLKRTGSSPLLLWAGICQSAFLVTWIGFIVTFSSFVRTQPQWSEGNPLISPEQMENTAQLSSAVFSVVFSLPLIPMALSLTALWIHYAACRSRKTGGVSTAGLTLWKVLNYIQLVAICVSLVALLVMVIAALAFSAFEGDASLGSEIPTAALVVLWLVYFVMMAGFSSLPVIGSALKIRLINRTKAVAFIGQPDPRTPTFVVVVNYIKMAVMALYGIMMIPFSLLLAVIPADAAVNMPSFAFLALLGAAMLLQAAYLVLVNVSISRYKRDMTRLLYPQVPYYPQVPVVPAAPMQPIAPEPPAEPKEEGQ